MTEQNERNDPTDHLNLEKNNILRVLFFNYQFYEREFLLKMK